MTASARSRWQTAATRRVPMLAMALALAIGVAIADGSPAAAQEAMSGAPVATSLDDWAPILWVERLAALGPRPPSTPAHAETRALLLDSLRRLGLEEIGAVEAWNGTRNVEGLLRGADPEAGEILLSAHYDTVEGSPGAGDDAAGCAVVLAALYELRETPLRRAVRVVFFDGEEAGLLGSEAWVAALPPTERDRILGSLHLDLVGIDREGAPVILDLGGAAVGPGPGRAPAWLVHAAIRAGVAVGFRFRVGDHRFPFPAQILTRTARVPWSSDAVALLEASIPAVLFTDFSALHPDEAMHTAGDLPGRLSTDRLDRWVGVTTATVRRLDALAGRPLWEEEYLVLAGRVFIRRDLTWIGLGLWILLVLRGRPGRWAGALTEERRARGRSYLPGYLFRLSFLVAAIWMPSIAAPLLYPLAPLGLLAPRSTAARSAVVAAALLPVALWLGMLAVAGSHGWVSGFALPAGKSLLLAGVLASFGWQVWSEGGQQSVGVKDPPGGAAREPAAMP